MSKNNIRFNKVFKDIIWPRRWILFIGLILIVISRGASFVIPLQTRVLIDEVRFSKDMDQLTILVLTVITALLIQGVMSFLLTRLLSVEAQHLIAKLRVQVQKKVLSLPINYFDNNQSGALVSRIMTDVEGVRNLVGTGFTQLIGGILTSAVSIYFLIDISPTMTLFTLGPILVLAVIMLKAFSTIRPIFRERGKINAEVTGRLTESIGGIRVIKGFNAEKSEINTFAKGADRLFQNVKRTLTSSALITSSSMFLIGLTSAGIMYFGGQEMMEKTLTAGEFTTFVVLLGFLVAPIVQMSNIGSQLNDAFAGLDRTQEIMNMEEESDDNRTVNISKINGDIKFNDVHFSYMDDKEVLHGVSFDAPPGSVTALVGSSGSGKSTIASLVASFMKPNSGTITIDGQDLTQVTLDSYRSKLGVVLQDDFLFAGTIRENILFPRPDASEEQVQHAIKVAYVDEFTDRFEDGLDTIIGERGVKLSGGQRQRIAIARAVLADPRILILDEATSNLDTESEGLIQKSLAELMKGRTTFVIAHRLSTIRKADQILVIEDGRIAERGTHDELLAKEGRYYDLFTYQSRI